MMAMSKEELDAFITTLPGLTTEKKMKLFVRLRETKSAHTSAYNEEQAQFKLIMETCENLLLGDADRQNVTGFKTDAGTSYIQEEVKVGIADSAVFTSFLDALPPDADRYGFFEARVSSNRVKEYIKLHGTPPPGLNIFRERVMRVRKAADKGDK
jgi:hypothetical protein